MKPVILAFTLIASHPLLAEPAFLQDSQRQEGVPISKVTRHELRSKVFRDTLRQYQLRNSGSGSILVVQFWVCDTHLFNLSSIYISTMVPA